MEMKNNVLVFKKSHQSNLYSNDEGDILTKHKKIPLHRVENNFL